MSATATSSDLSPDYLKVDPPLVVDCPKPQMTQKYAVISFVSPEDRIQERFLYEAGRFLYHDVNKQIIDTTTNVVRNLNVGLTKLVEKRIASYQTSSDPIYQAAAEILTSVVKDMVLDEDGEVNKVLRTYRMDREELNDRFEVYRVQNAKDLGVDFEREVTEATSVRGFKIRGAFETLEQARARGEFARNELEKGVHSFVAPIGLWCPYDPSADAVQDQEYMLAELNDMMGKYNRNAEQRDVHFQKRKELLAAEGGNHKEQALKDTLKERVQAKKNQRSHVDAQVPILTASQKKSRDKDKAKAKKLRQKERDQKAQVTSSVILGDQVTLTDQVNDKSLTFEMPKTSPA